MTLTLYGIEDAYPRVPDPEVLRPIAEYGATGYPIFPALFYSYPDGEIDPYGPAPVISIQAPTWATHWLPLPDVVLPEEDKAHG